jgi:hypothetical protein
MQSVKQKKEYIRTTLALYGYGMDTWSPGDGMTRYRITESVGVNYFSTYGIFTGTLNEVYTYCKALRYVYYHMPTQHSTAQES